MYTKVSIPKTKDGAGCAVAKDPNVIVMFAEDIQTEPTRVHGNVNLSGNYALKEGTHAIGIYLTPATIADGYDTEGEADGKGFKHKIEGEHPGNDAALENFVEGSINKGVVILRKECDGTAAGSWKAFGSKCNPLFLSPEVTDSKEANKTKLAWAQEQAQPYLPGTYTGTMPALDTEGSGSGSGSGSGDGA